MNFVNWWEHNRVTAYVLYVVGQRIVRYMFAEPNSFGPPISGNSHGKILSKLAEVFWNERPVLGTLHLCS